MHLAGFRAEKLPKVWAAGVRRAQVCCEDPHKHTGARVATTCIGVALPLPCQTGQSQKGVDGHQALVGDGYLFGLGAAWFASHGPSPGTIMFVGGVRTDLRSANNDGAQGAAVPCHPLHLSLRDAKKTPSKVCAGPLWPKVAPKRCSPSSRRVGAAMESTQELGDQPCGAILSSHHQLGPLVASFHAPRRLSCGKVAKSVGCGCSPGASLL